MSSITDLRLQLMREQAMQDHRTSKSSKPMNIRSTRNNQSSSSGSTPSGSGNNAQQSRTSPIIISHPIKFSGNKLVHLPPQIIHVQRHNDESGQSRVLLSGSVPATLGTPPKITVIRHDRNSITPQLLSQGSRQSPSIDSPPGYGDSPHSGASFPHAELDDYIIDEILSLEDDQLARKQQTAPPLSASYSCTDNLTNLSDPINATAGRPIPGASISPAPETSPSTYGGRQVSNSAPTSSLDIDSLVHQEVVFSENEFFRDRRKKDIHNMIERRRRYNINDRIKELGMMLPKHTSEDLKLNKGTILKASCDYIRHLQKDRDHMIKLQNQQAKLESAARSYAQRCKELESQLAKSGLPVPIPPASLPTVPTLIPARCIKQEPPEETNRSSPSFLSQLSDTTAAMAIHSPTGFSTSAAPAPGSFFSVGSHHSSDNSSAFSTPQQNFDPPSKNCLSDTHHSQNFPDLMMDLAGPLLQGDPMISAAGGGPSPQTSAQSQMSPDVQWDQSGFSPESDQQQTNNTQMDFT